MFAVGGCVRSGWIPRSEMTEVGHKHTHIEKSCCPLNYASASRTHQSAAALDSIDLKSEVCRYEVTSVISIPLRAFNVFSLSHATPYP